MQLFLVAFSLNLTYNMSNGGIHYGTKGKTSGSRVMFVNEKHGCILLHKPHPQKELKAYQIKQLIEILEQEGLI